VAERASKPEELARTTKSIASGSTARLVPTPEGPLVPTPEGPLVPAPEGPLVPAPEERPLV
jgi:hypothetical protein